MTWTIWQRLANRYHRESYTGHSYRRNARGCHECQVIAEIAERFADDAREKALTEGLTLAIDAITEAKNHPSQRGSDPMFFRGMTYAIEVLQRGVPS